MGWIALTRSVLPIGSGGKIPHPTDTRQAMFVLRSVSLSLLREIGKEEQLQCHPQCFIQGGGGGGGGGVKPPYKVNQLVF